jgi:D-sedoheptulose 7-phosphate isomerase
MNFPIEYRERLLSTLSTIDTALVAQAIGWMKEARDSKHTLFVAGNGGSAATAAHFVCDMVKGASAGKSRFRIVALGQNLPTMTAYSNDVSYADALVEELKNFAEPGDLYMAIREFSECGAGYGVCELDRVPDAGVNGAGWGEVGRVG